MEPQGRMLRPVVEAGEQAPHRTGAVAGEVRALPLQAEGGVLPAEGEVRAHLPQVGAAQVLPVAAHRAVGVLPAVGRIRGTM